MADAQVPYVTAYGNITKALQKIQSAATPSRFTIDFLSTKLGLKGGSARPVIPFLKRTGFLGSDGAPSQLYKQFRNPPEAGAAAAKALRTGYTALYEVNEYAHDLKDAELKGVVVQVTGLDESSSTIAAIVGSFKALKAFAKFDGAIEDDDAEDTDQDERDEDQIERSLKKLTLGYTINLHLPATSDVAVFSAIFKALKDNLL